MEEELMYSCNNCNGEVNEEDNICPHCGYEFVDEKNEEVVEKNFICTKCNNEVQESDEFCPFCGDNFAQSELEEEIIEFANDCIINAEGNKFKAIKLLKEKYDLENNDAMEYINQAFKKINDSDEFIDDKEQKLINLQEEAKKILKNNGNSKIPAIKELRDKYNLGLAEAKQLIDNIDNTSYRISNLSNNNEIEKTIIISQSSRKKATSAICRGLVGTALLGPVGLVAGGISAKSKEMTTFQIIYKNGKQKTVTVKNNSSDFKNYCKYL